MYKLCTFILKGFHNKNCPRFRNDSLTKFNLEQRLTRLAPLGKVDAIFRAKFPCPTIQAMNSQELPNSEVVQIMHYNVFLEL